jgi:hypothetical protein
MARRRRVAVLVDDSPGSMRACRYGANHVFDKETDVSLVTAVHATADGAPAVRRFHGKRRTTRTTRSTRTMFEPCEPCETLETPR